MANTNLNVKIINRHGSAQEWTAANPLLENGEIGVETDTFKLKVGDGHKNWNDLKYVGGSGEGKSDFTPEEVAVIKALIAQVSVVGNKVKSKIEIEAPSFNDTIA